MSPADLRIDQALQALHTPAAAVSVQIAPAVCLSLLRSYPTLTRREILCRLTAALRGMGAEAVYETATAAAFTVAEAAEELWQRLEGGGPLPVMFSCCPVWRRMERETAGLRPFLSRCASPMLTLARALPQDEKKNRFHIAVMPCGEKRWEAREAACGIDLVLTAEELPALLREEGIDLSSLPGEEPDRIQAQGPDLPEGYCPAYGIAGAVLACRGPVQGKSAPAGSGGQGELREFCTRWGERQIRAVTFTGIDAGRRFLTALRGGKCDYQFVEILACPGGCATAEPEPTAE